MIYELEPYDSLVGITDTRAVRKATFDCPPVTNVFDSAIDEELAGTQLSLYNSVGIGLSSVEYCFYRKCG